MHGTTFRSGKIWTGVLALAPVRSGTGPKRCGPHHHRWVSLAMTVQSCQHHEVNFERVLFQEFNVNLYLCPNYGLA